MAGYGGIRQTGWRWLPNYSANITISNSSISATVPKWVDHRCTPNNQVGAERSSLVRIAPRRQPCSRIHLHQSGRVPRFPGILGLHTRHRHVNTPEDATNHHVDSKFRVVARAMSSQAPHSPPHNFFEALVAPSTSRVETGLPWAGFVKLDGSVRTRRVRGMQHLRDLVAQCHRFARNVATGLSCEPEMPLIGRVLRLERPKPAHFSTFGRRPTSLPRLGRRGWRRGRRAGS